MIRRRRIGGLFIGAAAAAASLPIVGAVGAPTVVLPDLVADPPERAGAAYPPENYTYPDGTQALLLRFDGYIHNAGAGPLEMRGSNRSGASMTTVSQYAQPAAGGALVPVASPGGPPRISYDAGDGHNHWHLAAAARYSLWNSGKTAEVAPAMKAGFCLEDTQRRETNGPATAVYTDGGVRFCQQNNPTTASVFMGTSAGWRDLYHRNLAYQWVDVSTVQPGQYWVAAEVDPTNVVSEANEGNNTRAFSREVSTVPGYWATAVNAGTLPAGQASTVTLASQAFGSPGARRFAISTLPAKGTLSVGGTALARGAVITGSTVTYTPISGATGADSFDFTAYDSTSQFPRQPAAASVSLTVGTQPAQTAVAVSGAPASMAVSTSAQLTATVTNGSGATAWSVNGVAGGNATVGTVGASGLYTAPSAVPAGGSVTVRATNNGAFDEKTIRITATPDPDPAPQPATNLVANPSFETDTSGWGRYQATITRTQVAGAPDGVYAARVAQTTGTTFTIDDAPDTVLNAKAGVTYSARAFVRAASASSVGKTVRLYLRESTATARVRTVQGPAVTLTNDFQAVGATISGQAAGNEIDMYVAQANAAAGDAFFIDAISLSDGSGGTTPPVNRPPTADFTRSPQSPVTGQTVTFTDASTDSDGTITARAWDLDDDRAFDDGSTASVSRSFAAPGDYTVRLQVTDNTDAPAVATKVVTVTAAASGNVAPSASFSQSAAAPVAGDSVTFTDTSTDSDGTIQSRAWDLDDDGAFDDATTPTATRSFAAAGDYTVRLQVTDNGGATATASRVVRVGSPSTGGTNLVANPSFESAVTGWVAYQGALSRVALTGAPDGAYVAKVTRSTGTSFTIDDSPETVSSAASTPYTVRAMVRAASASSVGKPVRITVREATATAYLRKVSGTSVALTDSFQPVTVQISAPAAGNEIDFYIAQDSAVTGDAFYVDAIQLTSG